MMAKILVVEDEASLRSFLVEALELAGHDVAAAEDGRMALERAREERFHLVLTDLAMPHLDGMGLLSVLRREQPDVEVVVLTAHGSIEAAVDAMRQGAFDFLQKPLGSPGELRLVVERALERRRLRSAKEQPQARAPQLAFGPPMDTVVKLIDKVAATDATVLLLGESGTGKEVAARTLHERSPRQEGPFSAVNCAALSPALLESELFGHEKGAFTGADERRRGRLELAEGGTFFLDEIGELPRELQAKLLRVLQEKRFERVGGHQTIVADVRWVAATHRDLPNMVREGSFREDLFHRIAVFPVTLPPLRERGPEIAPLAEALLDRVGAEMGRPRLRLSAEALAWLPTQTWPGNVRALRNRLERAVILAEGASIDVSDLSGGLTLGGTMAHEITSESDLDLATLERQAVARAMARHGNNRKLAAAALGIGVRTLYDKLKRYELES